MTTRHPKGTPIGGRFAESRKPNGGDLLVERDVVADADKKRYVAAITRCYAGYASTMPHNDVSRYLPNDRGFALLASSSLVATEEGDGGNGTRWSGTLRIGGKTVHVWNSGEGGLNHYSLDGETDDPSVTEELDRLVREGFPNLDDAAPIDQFCFMLDAIEEGKP